MDTQKLKDKILQLAIQGKLVEQDPNDEPASELLKKIEAEKKKLYKEGKIRKPKKLPPIKDEEKPFHIPESWEWARLNEYLDVRDGTHDTPKYIEEGIPLITSKNIRENSLDFENVKYISIEDHIKISERSKVEYNDILFAMIGSIGNPSLVKTNKEFSIKNVALFKHYKPDIILPKYVYYFLLGQQDKIKKLASGGVQSFVSLTFLRNYLLTIPPLNEQKRIVEKIDGLFELIDNLDSDKEKLLETIEFTRNKVLQDAIKGKLVAQDPNDEPASELLKKIEAEKNKLYKEGKIRKPKKLPPIKEEEKPFDIPRSWEWVRFGNSCNIIMGQSPKGNTVGEEGIEFHQGKIFFGDKYLKKSDKFTIKPKKIANIEDVILSVRAPVGTVNITERQICIGRGLCAIRPLLKIKTDFNYYWIKAFNENLLDKSTGTTFKAISMTTINELVIPLPPLNEQKRIVEKIDRIFNYFNLLEELVRD